MYGLQNVPSSYADGLRTHLNTGKYYALANDPNVYARRTAAGAIYMAVTTDDFTYAIDAPAIYRELLGHLRTKYQVKNLGSPVNMLGWSTKQDLRSKAIHITQLHLAHDFIHAARPPMRRAAPTPYLGNLDWALARASNMIVD